MNRIHLQNLNENSVQETITINDHEIVKKLYKVLRLVAGDKIVAFNGHGLEFECEILTIDASKLTIKPLHIYTNSFKPRYIITLAQALTKFSKLDDIIKMNTEIGVEQFTLFESEFSILKNTDVKQNKIERLEKIAEEASRQSERSKIPEISAQRSFNELLTNSSYDLVAILDSREGVPLHDATSGLAESSTILVIVGPEGGFSPKELAQAKSVQESNNAIRIINLSTPILRTETAGIVFSGALLA